MTQAPLSISNVEMTKIPRGPMLGTGTSTEASRGAASPRIPTSVLKIAT